MSADEKKNYKKTLNLPVTEFPMRGGLANKEPKYLQRWDEMDLYGKIIAQRQAQDAPRFILHDGPPYANGHIHHGHVLNKVLKDFVVKYRTMAGHYAPYVPGWDCHGLPIEHKVDEELGDDKRDLSQVEIRRRCREYAERFVGIQREEFARLGVFGQWDDPYTTMSYGYEARTVRELGRFFGQGNVYKGLKPVHWSWAAQTALADAEVEYEAHVAPSIYVKFAFPRAPSVVSELAGDAPIFVLIWTTTPWTLPANLAIVLHPDFDYVVVRIDAEGKHQGHALVVAKGLMEQTLKDCRIDLSDTTTLGQFKGHQLVGRTLDDAPRPTAQHPFIDRPSVLLPADYVTLEQGTGCVHTAPGHGQEDFMLGRQAGLEVLNPVDEKGCYTHKYAEREGVHVFKANPAIVADLDERGALLSHPKLTVSIDRYPHCWRTKTPVIFRATEQWFISMDAELSDGTTLRQRAMREIDEVAWVPGWGKDRIVGMMENRPDWCISRQRLWGVPITVFYCRACDASIADQVVADHVADLAEQHGSDVWFEREPAELTPQGYACGHCGAPPEEFRKETDILDVWFDSGVSWSAVVDKKLGLGEVADLYLEGSDQHRGWFNSSLLAGVGTRDHAPFRTCLTHGFVCDEEGRKYSKSSKNFVPPEKMINTDGAEILRLWVAAVDYRSDITLSPTIIKTVKDAYRKIRNTSRFLLGNVSDFTPTSSIDVEALDPLDRWALSRTQKLVRRVLRAYDEYEFHIIYHQLVRFSTVELSNTYLNILKDRLYAEPVDAPARRASQSVLYEILHTLVRLMAPVLAFTAEEIWDHMAHRDGDPASVHLADLPTVHEAWIDEGLEARFETLLSVKAEVERHIDALRPKKRGERQPGQLGASEEAHVRIVAGNEHFDVLSQLSDTLTQYFIVAEVDVVAGEPAPMGEDDKRAAPVDVEVTPSGYEKCPRCWRFWPQLSPGADVCQRCHDALSE